MTAKIDIENRQDSNAVSVEPTDLFGIRRPLLCADRPWSEYPLGTKAHSCIGGWWLRTERGWQWNGKHGTFPTPGGEACGACIELPVPNAIGEALAGTFDIEAIEQAFFNHDNDGSELRPGQWERRRDQWRSFKAYLAAHPSQEVESERTDGGCTPIVPDHSPCLPNDKDQATASK